jgi:prepilin-type N-terminal cleavage/methylation domain-containing protein
MMRRRSHGNQYVQTGKVVKNKAGFTLIELLVAICMLSLLMAGVISVMTSMRRSYTTQEVAAGAQQNVRMAIAYMVNDIRLAGLDPSQQANTGFEQAIATSLRFTSDRVPEGETDSNGEIDDDNFERLTYYWNVDDNTLRLRLYGSIEQTLVDNVTNLRFRYFDRDGDETADLTEIRSVQILLTVQEPAGREGLLERSYSTRVRCRNMGI